ncbi:Cullin family-domain-containing protein [Cokeromyces recurvatus]|uniref:Cullin family-domain-containing protein n=1 Tax=Cokeromyces recurvatus TaxID=90255 RepID=UPI00221ED5E3|nr:Cullin family-domain-containing protein [Cokeromyces recurvatus]KAI7898057.1 Cullin family-domain-containing protein [Cokeromyces recurvatus]
MATNRDIVKKPRLEYDQSVISSASSQLPFSNYLSNSHQHNRKHPVLSDKKLIVYDLKVDRPELDFTYEESALLRLKNAIHSIQNNQLNNLESLEVLYQLCENLCQYDRSKQLFNLLYNECYNYIMSQFEILASNPKDGIEYLQIVHSLWNSYCRQTTQLRCIFLYLDRTFIASHTKQGSFWNMAMNLFKENFQKYQIVWQKVLNSILDMIKQDRIGGGGGGVDEAFLQLNTRMLMDLSLYHSSFEQQFLVQTQYFYEEEGNRLLNSIDIFDYLEHVSIRVHQESIIRIKSYLDKSTKSQLQLVVENELLTKRVNDILMKCFKYFQNIDTFQEHDYDKFSLLYRLLQKVNQLEICSKYFANYVKKKGSSILCSKSDIFSKIERLSAFESQNDELVDHSFEGDEIFADSLKDSTEYYLNLRENNAIKLLAKYMDQLLRNSSFDEVLLDKGMFLFRNLQSKDEFEILYKCNLAKRLLLGISNRNTEKLVLARMKKECSPGYTGKLEGMVKDIEKSVELMKEFQSNATFDSLSLNMNVNLLTYGFWPSYTLINASLPTIFLKAQNEYTQFYTSKFEKRVLTWQNALGICEINANYPNGTKKITLTLLQTIVLLLFNDQTKRYFSFMDILKYTQLDELELQRILMSLTCKEYKLLRKVPEGNEEIESTDQFEFNHDFSTYKDQFSVITSTLSEVIEKNSRLDTTILFAREQQIDAVIVRIMKAKTTLTHGALLNEVTRVVRFSITAQEIKKRIEVLIDK